MRPQVSSTLAGSAKFSFGMPKHQKGKFKITVLDPRCPEYKPGVKAVPGAGHYEVCSSLARHDSNRGHPEYRRAPGFCFGTRTEPRDCVNPHPAPTQKRFTTLSHVRSDSFLDVPGPGAYIGVNESQREHGLEQLPIRNKQPAYTMRSKCGASWQPNHEGPGPFAYDTRTRQTVLGRKQPRYSIGRMERKAIALTCDLGTEDHVGPGRYEYASGIGHSQF